MTADSTPAERSIYQHIRAHLAPGGVGLLPGGEQLPDDPGDAWAPGARDGVVTHHLRRARDAAAAQPLLEAVRAAVTDPAAADSLRRLSRDPKLVSLLDPLLEQVRAAGLPKEPLYQLAWQLAVASRERGAVKLGIALLGLFRPAPHREVLHVLGRHDEFTLYAAVAFANSQADPDEDLWQLARGATGWGRVQVVPMLAGTSRDDIREWILREGFRNSVMYEYLAYTAATAGDLLGWLRGEHGEIDDDLLAAAGEILAALARGGPARDMSDYADGPAAMELYLTHVERQAGPEQDPQRTLEQLVAVGQLRDYLSTGDHPARLRQLCADLLDRPHWAQAAIGGLTADDPLTFAQADQACQWLGIDTFDAHLARLRESRPGGSWYEVMRQAGEQRIDAALSAAVEILPLDQIATGAGREPGLGPGFAAHRQLDFVLQGLRQWPGRGLQLIEAGLRSPVIRNRNLAAAALAAWPRDAWPGPAEAALRAAIAAEPDEEVRGHLTRALLGEAGPD